MTNRFVFDTNVIVSAALRRQSIPRQALDIALTHGHVLLSQETVSELREVLFRSKFDKLVVPETRLSGSVVKTRRIRYATVHVLDHLD